MEKIIIQPLSKIHQKWIRGLHQKKHRQEENVFLAEGWNSFEAAAKFTHHRVKEIVFDRKQAQRFHNYHIRGRFFDNNSVYMCTEKEMASISTEEHPQGIILICHQRNFAFEEAKEKLHHTIIYCEKISDPGNLGTIIRSAAWFGVRQILLGPSCVDPFNTKVIRSSAGSIFSMEIYQGVTSEELYRFARAKGYQVSATVPEGGLPIHERQKANKNIILLGHESDGLSGEIIQKADQRISIPGTKDVESLNLAVAAAIIIYEITQK